MTTRTAFKDLPWEERIRIATAFAEGGEVHCLDVHAGEWYVTGSLFQNGFYRIALTPMSVNFAHLADKIICAVRNASGLAWGFAEPPVQLDDWWKSMGVGIMLNHLKSYVPGTVDWKDSLIWRPGYGPGGKL